MATEYFKASKEIHDQMMSLIGGNHPDLAEVSDRIAVVFRDKGSKSAPFGTSRKASPLMNALLSEGEDPLVFVLELPADLWEFELTSKQREALLDYRLCACQVEVDDAGDSKPLIAKPDLMVFRENFERYGMWFPKENEDDSSEEEENLSEAILS